MTATIAFGSLEGCGKIQHGTVNTKYEKDEKLKRGRSFSRMQRENYIKSRYSEKNEFITDYDDNTFTKKA
ncbi:MAG: hypothetical protein L6V93_20595 [Clostridiales bacterium]|nr:MAG: hypothetical protein L6V93_20595 [Clostridiales bacterium]